MNSRYTLAVADKLVPLTTERPVVVGRGVDCDVSLDADLSMSRRHASFIVRDDAVWVEDLGSRNGTLVNGKKLEKAVRVGSGDRVVIGGHVLSVLDEEDKKRTSPTRPQRRKAADRPRDEWEDESTVTESPDILVGIAETLAQQGQVDSLRKALVRMMAAVRARVARNRAPDGGLARRGIVLLLGMAQTTQDGIWIDRALDLSEFSGALLDAELAEVVLRVYPNSTSTASGTLRRYCEVMRARVKTAPERATLERLTVLASLD